MAEGAASVVEVEGAGQTVVAFGQIEVAVAVKVGGCQGVRPVDMMAEIARGGAPEAAGSVVQRRAITRKPVPTATSRSPSPSASKTTAQSLFERIVEVTL